MTELACKILHAAKDRLTKNGRAVGEYKNPDGSYCMLGALGFGSGWDADFEKVIKGHDYGDILRKRTQAAMLLNEAIFGSIQARTTGGLAILRNWNDNPKRKDTEVFAALDKAIFLCETRTKG